MIDKNVKQFEMHNFFSESLEEVDDEESVYSDDEDSEGEVIEEYIPKYTEEAKKIFGPVIYIHSV